jgi:ribonuclease P protein component
VSRVESRGFSFRYSERIHSQKDFKRALSLGKKLFHPAVHIYIFKRNDGSAVPRLGLVTSRKVGIAVRRNRVKRRLREIFRLNKHFFSPGIDIIFKARKEAAGLKYKELENIIISQLKKAKAVKKGSV